LATKPAGNPSADNSDFTGVAVLNLDETDAACTFTAFDRLGNALEGLGVTNPVTRTLKAGEQLAIMDWELWGSGMLTSSPSPVGWFKMESNVSKVTGFFLTLSGGLSVMDGADVGSEVLRAFVLPEIENKGFTELSIANPGPSAALATLQLMGSDGRPGIPAVTREIGPNGVMVESLSALFPGANPDADDYLKVSSTSGVVPFELLGMGNKYVKGLNGQDTMGGATVLYCPQYATGGMWRSELSVINLDTTPGTVEFRLMADNGTQVGNTRQVAVEGEGKIHITDQDFFVRTGSTLTQGYLQIKSSGPRLTGSVVFGDAAGDLFSTALPLVSRLSSSVVFSQLASNEIYYTGIALLNPNSVGASLNVEVFDEAGIKIDGKLELIPPAFRRSLLLTEYFPSLEGRNLSRGYIRIAADQPIAGFALFGTSREPWAVSAVPPQSIPGISPIRAKD
jgi:hypothetical protein